MLAYDTMENGVQWRPMHLQIGPKVLPDPAVKNSKITESKGCPWNPSADAANRKLRRNFCEFKIDLLMSQLTRDNRI